MMGSKAMVVYATLAVRTAGDIPGSYKSISDSYSTHISTAFNDVKSFSFPVFGECRTVSTSSRERGRTCSVTDVPCAALCTTLCHKHLCFRRARSWDRGLGRLKSPSYWPKTDRGFMIYQILDLL